MSGADSRRPRRGLIVNLVLSLVALALLGLAIWSNQVQLREVLFRPPGAPPVRGDLLVLAFLAYMTALVTTFLRWYVLVRALDLPFRVRDSLRLGFIGNVFNLVIPGAVGGDVIKAAYLCREQARKTQAVSTMVIDRALGLLALFLLAGVMGLGIWSTADPEVRRLITVVWSACVSGLLGLAMLFTPALYRPLQWLFAGRGRLEVMVGELVAMASSYRRRLGTLAAMLVLSVGIHALYVTAFYLVSRAIFPAGVPSLAQHLLMVPLVLFTTAIPIPFGALGVSEQVSAQLFRLVNHPGGAVAMMGFRILMYAGGLVSLIVYFFNIGQVRELSRDVSPAPGDLVVAES